jgi:nicotinamidase-related amidase
LSIGVFFALMIAGLASTLPKSLTSGLHQQGVPQSIAPHAGSLPPVSSLFAAMLGVNPVQHLLAASRVLATLPAAAQRILTGREFFPDLISGPFHHGLVIVFAFAVALSVVAAVASMLRGGRPTDAWGTDELLPTPDPMPTTAVLGDSTAVVTEDRGRGDDSAFSCLASISTTSGTSQQPDGRKEEHMALTTLDDKVALVVIDLQTGVVAAPTVHPVDEIVGRSATLAAAFRRHALPVVLVNVAGGAPGRTDVNRPAFTPPPDFADLVEELDVQPGDHLVTKHRRSAFHDTSLHAHLRSLGVTQIVLAGVATTSGVESTARAAYDHGYHVVLATDAMTDTNADAHHNSIERIFPKLGETATTAEILDMLDKTR